MSACETLAVAGEKMLENAEGMVKLLLGNWIYNFAPSFKCPLLSDKSCLPIIRRHVNSSLARSLTRSLTRRAFLWKRLVLQCGSPLTSTFINDVELSSTLFILVAPATSSLLPKIVVRLILSSFPVSLSSFCVIIQRDFSLFFPFSFLS